MTALFFSITSAECPFSKNKSSNKLASFFMHGKRIGRCGLQALYKKPICTALAALGIIFKHDSLVQWPLILPSLLVITTLTHEYVGNICTEYNLDYENDHKPISTFIASLTNNKIPAGKPGLTNLVEDDFNFKFEFEELTEEEIATKQEEVIIEPIIEEKITEKQPEVSTEETISVKQKEVNSEPIVKETRITQEEVRHSAETTHAIQGLLTFAQQLQKHKNQIEATRTQVPNPEEPQTNEDSDDIVEVVIAPRAVEAAA